jgi:YD repeat-containing protein
MSAIVSGNALGLDSTSLATLGAAGQTGQAATGRSGERVYLNIASGNLVVQREDEALIGRGPDIDVLRTYNSQGQTDGDNNDNWRIGFYRQIKALSGAVNTAGSTVVRVDRDGAELTYAYDANSHVYAGKDGAGSFDTLNYNSATANWTWTDGDSRVTETYDWHAGAGKLLSQADTSGNTITYHYAGSLLNQVLDASGDSTWLDYSGNNLTRVRSVLADGTISTRVHYGYDASNRLDTVTVDLSPQDNSIVDGKTYVTRYTYDGASKRIATLTQSDGTDLVFLYTPDGKLSRITDALGHQTNFSYDSATKTTVTDALGFQTSYVHDALGQLARIAAPAVNGVLQSRSFGYNGNGDVTSTTDGQGNVINYQYDDNGNQTLQLDALGNTISRTYDSNNQLSTETLYVVPDPDGGGPLQAGTPLTTRYVHDTAGKSQLRYAISPTGRVTQTAYDDQGQLSRATQFTGLLYTAAAATQTALDGWVSRIADKTQSLITDYTYNFRGQVFTETSYDSVDASGAGVGPSITTYVHGPDGALLQKIAPLGVDPSQTAAQTTTYTYDGLGRLLTSVNGLNELTQYQYADTLAGGVVSTAQTLANGLITISSHDAAGRLVSFMHTDAANEDLQTTRYVWDDDNRLQTVENALGIQTRFLYDAIGRLQAEVDGKLGLTEYFYNKDDQLTLTIRYATPVTSVGGRGAPGAGPPPHPG